MPRRRPAASPTVRLQLCWDEPRPGEERGQAWGQFVGSLHRLAVVREELEEAARHPTMEKALGRLQIHVEGYLARAYELRERAVSLTERLFPEEKNLGEMKDPKKRPPRISTLALRSAQYADALNALLGALDEDTSARNMHTHENYALLRLFVADTDYDPKDVWELRRDRPMAPEFRRILRQVMRATANEYSRRIEQVHDAGMRLAEVADKLVRDAR